MTGTDECWRKEGVVLWEKATMLAQEEVMSNGCRGSVPTGPKQS